MNDWRVLAALSLAGITACATTPISTPRPPSLKMTAQPDSAEYTHFIARGTGAIAGQAFLTTRGGDVKLGAGRTVTLDPATAYAMEWYRQIGADQNRFDEAPVDSLFKRARRTTTVDAQGHFRFASLPAGAYLLRSVVSWETGAQYAGPQGGVVADTLTLGDGEQREIILNHVVTPSAPMSVVALTKEQIGDRKFSVVSKVSGQSCRRSVLYDPEPTESVARADLMENATRTGADAVTNIVCEKGGLSFRKNCTSFIECKVMRFIGSS